MEKKFEGLEKSRIKNLFQFLNFLEEEFGKRAVNKFLRPFLEQKVWADLSLHQLKEEERIKRLKNKQLTPENIEELNDLIDTRVGFMEKDLEQADKLKKDTRKQTEEMLNVFKNKEIIMNEEGNVGVRVKEEK